MENGQYEDEYMQLMDSSFRHERNFPLRLIILI